MKKPFVVIIMFLLAGGVFVLFRSSGSSDGYTADNVVFGIRGFRHQQLFASGGTTEQYEVDVGEEFKVLWIIHQLTNDGQISWHGPAGVGEGSETIKAQDGEVTGLKVLTATEPGVAEFTLTAPPAGGQPEDKEAETNKIIVTIR